MIRTSHTTSSWGHLHRLIVCVMMCLLTAACGADDSGDGSGIWFEASRPEAYERGDLLLSRAENDLIRHDIRTARSTYAAAMLQNDPYVVGTAAAGKSVTGVMLLGDEAPVRKILVDGFGATNGDYDTQRLLWAREGMLDWFEQGGRWEDDGTLFLGVKSLVASELPWSPARLESPTTFFQGLNSAVGDLSPTLIELALVLQGIEKDIQVSLNDPKFEYFYLPAAVFHNEALAFALNKSELAAVHGVLSMVRGALYMITAYEHTWTFEQLIGSPGSPRQMDGEVDYAQLDAIWFRSVQREGSLREARRAFQDGFDLFARAISLGLELPDAQLSELSILRWDRASREDLRKVRDVLQALSYSLDEPTKMPHFSKDFTLNLSPFFEGSGRVLAPETTWFVYNEGAMTWELSRAAEQEFFLRDVFSPEAVAGEPYPVTFEVSGERMNTLVEMVTGALFDRLSRAYGL